MQDYSELIDKTYTFEDGNWITVIQIKRRDNQQLITYNIGGSNNLPRKLIMEINEFVMTYGHLFGINDIPTSPRR
jgi:hypothetical protein